jgi:hypothetical protein
LSVKPLMVTSTSLTMSLTLLTTPTAAGAYGSLGLERPEGDLIPFADLTEATVVGWAKEKLTAEKVTEIEAALQAQLDEQRQPTKAGGLPWS